MPPKWFTKDPSTLFAADLVEMLAAIRQAAECARAVGERASAFAWWREVHAAQSAWARGRGLPPLLAGLGTSLVERALVDGFCRATGSSFAVALRDGALGIRPSELHPELPSDAIPALLPARPAGRVQVRHTVGLADPLEDSDIASEDRLDDGLPQSLASAIGTYGLTHFKIKLCGQVDRDLDRLRRVAAVFAAAGVREPKWTLDGNEQFTELPPFRSFWERFRSEAGLAALRAGLIVVEQPLHRAVALGEETGREMRRWETRPPTIIDESDGEPDSLRRALELGYVGTSHKNCKGVFRGVANACLVRYRRSMEPRGRFELTSEDLATVGPAAMLPDLCVAACLGIEHSERNGHHYFRGLSMFPVDLQESVLRVHSDLYRRAAGIGTRGSSFPTLDIRRGGIATGSVLAAPFGCGIDPEVTRFTPLEDWNPDRL